MHPLPEPGPRAPLRPLRRPDGSVQVGLGPRAVRFLDLTTAEHRWLTGLETTRALPESVAAATLEGIEPTRASDILERLLAAGLLAPLTPAPPLLAVVGSGALPALLVDVLRSDRLEITRVRPGGEAEARAGLAVVVSAAPPAAEAVSPWLAAEVPVLPLWCLPEQASIGPLLRPGRGPCVHCLDLTRCGLDPGWPWLRAQLAPAQVTGPEPVDGLPALRLLAAGLTATLVHDRLAGRLGSPEWSFQVATPGPTLERHEWPTHPGCPRCSTTAPQPPATPSEEGRFSPGTGWKDTMAG